ncbi:AAA domain-containing protein [Sphingomonas psychrotolerans]|uniref:DNA helicase n=1 Tax=Sphingomonas psychrotolerans TaxID=1327635 RepID=A0A2K8MNI1_9SPHN|nr:AAA domain-containing protein [Sphingomonas psychrotolerans]ATY34754.1 DNA helicase [Sphingomonas psychrotolerans]
MNTQPIDTAESPHATPARTLRMVIQDGRLLPSDDLVHAVLGLMRQVAQLHAEGRVARLALDTVIELDDGRLALADPVGIPPSGNLKAIHAVQPQLSSALKLVGNYRVTQDEERGTRIDDLRVLDGDELTIESPAYVTRLRSWEIELGHHDEITDVFQLGMIMASLACGLDPANVEDLGRFSLGRDNLFAIAPRLHPVIASLILEATELNRHERAHDLAELARRLDTWRDQPTGIAVERVLAEARGVPGRRTAVLAHLRDRLFDLSRRNRLIHFRSTQSSVNFTDASIPIVMRIESVRADSLCTWKGQFAKDLLGAKPVSLNRWLRFEDQPQIPSQLDRIIQENRRNRNEYGFSSLRLTVAFLHWHNLKEAPEERISSPLLWLPAEVARRKGVRDQYVLSCQDPVAEFNPALRHMLRQLYDIDLPETVDLSETPIEAIHQAIRAQIHESAPGVRLELQERPAIRLILQRAVQRVNRFNRRRSGQKETIRAKADFNYSRDDYRPLGLALFEKFVKPDPLPQRLAAGGGHIPKREFMVAETEATAYGKAGGEGHKFSWEIDLTQVTLANFNYKKMSLVRDYNALIETPEPQPAFDQVFSIEPRPFVEDAPPPIPPTQQWSVVPSDATQEQAVAFARTARSFIIQGPPGTGKSQTITNLIADFAGQGKRVLFVCEKRAALDVVFHRLGQAGLDGLATIIHDSQDDKNAFIADLREQYERWGRTTDGLEDAHAARTQTVAALEGHLHQIAEFEAAVGRTGADGEPPLRDLVRRAAALPPVGAEIGPAARETLPSLALWDAQRDMAVRVFRGLHQIVGAQSLAVHPFARLCGRLLREERPYTAVEAATQRAEVQLQRLDELLDDAAVPLAGSSTLADTRDVAALAEQLVATGLAAASDLLDRSSPQSQTLDADLATIAVLKTAEQAAARTAHAWHDPLDAADTAAALELARAKEGSLFAVFSGSWRALKATIRTRYDFASHVVAPKVSTVLEALAALHQAREAHTSARTALERRIGTTDLAGLLDMRARLGDAAPGGAVGATLALARSGDRQALACIARHAPTLRALDATLDGALDAPDLLTLDELAELLRDLRENLDDLPDLLPHLAEVHNAPAAVAAALTRLPLPLASIEALVLDEAIAARERANPDIRRFDVDRMIALSRRVAAARDLLRDQNSAAIRATLHRQFRDHVKLSETSITQLDNAARGFKKVYATGRRELEHEFGKSMRYKSIRELASGDSGRVVNDLKPIWLMSPLSVSDTLPLAPDLFDVVIFDEASQIPTEDAVPALCRSRQVVIVGDEMQLPPTSFFSTAQSDDEMEVTAEEDGERIAIVLDADSLLSQAARNLPATLLAWHYRSRFEALISFSNAAFYAGDLVTIPDRTLRRRHKGGEPVQSDSDEAWAAGAERLLSAPITTHRVADGVYDRRANLPEARYIAGLVRELLARETGQSIGIVAFSEAQQSEIEDALERLAAEDDAFSTALTREVEREENGQFSGLFVKNLENVQGDERDVILMSVCYAPDSDGRMAMNFGPINQRGGEKRLNVIFSRAKRHMAIVSTIAPEAITNIHNDGARALRSFLAFAEAQSAGAEDSAQAVLATLNPDAARVFDAQLPPDPVREAMAAALRAKGHEVHEHVGGASFRCDLAVLEPGGEGYALGVLLDRAATGPDAIEERFVFRPGILRAFGWRVVDVPVTSWLRARDAVIERIEQELRRSSWDLAEADPLGGTNLPPLPTASAAATEVKTGNGGAVAPTGAAGEDAQPFVGMTEYRLVAGTSNKFWRVGVAGTDLIVEFGRVGTKGQRVVKSFEDEDRARREASKLAFEKTRKGYEEVG